MIKTQKTHSALSVMLIGVLVCILCFLFMSLIFGAVIYYTADPLSYSGIGALCAFLFSAALSALINAKRAHGTGAPLPVLSALIFSLSFLFAGIIVSGGQGALKLLMNTLSYLLITLLFSFLGSRRGVGRRRAKSAHRHKGRAL